MTFSTSLNDRDIVQLHKEGNDSIFGILIKRHKESVYNSIRRYIKTEHLADDIFQEVFIKALNSINEGKYIEDEKFKYWLLKIARNLCIDYIKKKQPNQISLTEAKLQYNVFMDSTLNPEAMIILKEENSTLFCLIEELPIKQKEVIILRYYYRLPFKRIAFITNCSKNTALGRVRYAISNLKKKYNQSTNSF